MNEKITILVLNWNGNQDTIHCLKSLEKVEDKNFNITIIDNNSKLHPINEIKLQFPQFDYLELNKNYGYSGGNNRGFEATKDDSSFTCFLNNDVVVEANFIKNFRIAIQKFGKQNIFGPQIFFEYPSERIWYGGGIVNLREGHISHESIGLLSKEVSTEMRKTDYITGCCLLVSNQIFEKLNGFDEQFNMYAEDVDLCLRARKYNINSIYVPKSKIWHKVSSSIGGRFSVKKYIKKIKSIKKLVKIHEPDLNSIFISFKIILSSLFKPRK